MGEFLVPTGRIIKEYLEARGISQKDLSHRIDVSEKHISNLLNGKARLTEDMALKLERVMPDVSAGYWLNYEAKYREFLAREKERDWLEGLDLKEVARRFHFKEVFKNTSMTLVEQADEMLKILGVSSFDQYRYALPNTAIEFMQDGGDSEAVVVWLKLCEEDIEEQNPALEDKPYSKDRMRKSLPILKSIAYSTDLESSLKDCRKLFNQQGVYFVVEPAIANSKVRGALSTWKDHPAIFISGRFKSHDHVWFAIFHEVVHLLQHYNPKQAIVSYEELASEKAKDDEANKLARDFLVDASDYATFKSTGDFSEGSIRRFAASQGVLPDIIVGFLQHDHEIGFADLSYMKRH